MKAAIFTEYGSPQVLKIKNVDKPVPTPHQLLIKVIATAVNSGDWRLRKADPFAVRFFLGLSKPKINILGGVFSGKVEQVGKEVTRFKVGDEVFGETDMTFGAYAEYLCFPEEGSIALKPHNITHQEAATTPFGAHTALYFIRKAQVKPGQKVLVYGASGSVGCAAVQLAQIFGATVTGVCSSSNTELVRSLGAERVLDYNNKDFSLKGEAFDVIIDTVNKMPLANCLKSLKPGGRLVLSAAGLSEMIWGLFASAFTDKIVLMGVISHTAEDLAMLQRLLSSGRLKAIVDRSYPLEQIAEAHEYAEKGHKKGNIAITL